MQRNTEKNGRQKGGKTLWRAGCITMFLLAVFITVLFCLRKKSQDVVQPVDYVCDLGAGIMIRSVDSYTGAFLEDGSDREVENVWQLTVENVSEKNIQLLTITAQGKTETARFQITTLEAGSTVTVLESAALPCPENAEETAYKIEDLAYLEDELSIFPEQFTVSAKDGWIQVENIGEEDITEDIYVYYKNFEDGVFRGGITYRVRFEGGIPAGESREEQTQHYSPEKSRILYLTYGQKQEEKN